MENQFQPDADAVRDQATAFADALVAGDVDRAIEHLSRELRRNLGEVLALFPLPASEATLESVDQGGSGYNVVIRLVGDSEEARVQTRWKDRDGQPTIIEASHLSRSERLAETDAVDVDGTSDAA